MRVINILYRLIAVLIITSCGNKMKTELTPWGTPMGEDTVTTFNDFTLSDIISNGEMIMLTLNGPDTYFEYHGKNMGTQYLLCELFAQQIGVSLRVEVCRDTTDLISRLRQGEGDVAALLLPDTLHGVLLCGFSEKDTTMSNTTIKRRSWAVREQNKELADTLTKWYSPDLLAKVRSEEAFFFSNRSVQRRVYSPMLNRSGGVISQYDHLFKKYAGAAGWDWRLLAAQCYQESTFDSQARSWAGACGLMQIMPSTASHLGLSMGQIFQPEANIAAAARYIRELDSKFSDIPLRTEKLNFVLACYNGGYHHIRDAMALARKYGRNPYRWNEVSEYVLLLSTPQYYNDPVVKYGYMRGSETVDYVERIRNRWAQYRGIARSASPRKASPAIPKVERKKALLTK